MTKDFKHKFYDSANEIIDLRDLNLFETTKAIIMISSNCKLRNKKLKFKVSTPNIENILKDIPLYKQIELVLSLIHISEPTRL